MFYAHVIEDLIALHLHECSFLKPNGYNGLTPKQIRELKHEERINELLRIYRCDASEGIQWLVAGLHLIRKIRNQLAHAIIPQVGSDFLTSEGIDQVLAMLQNVIRWELVYLGSLRNTHEGLLRAGLMYALQKGLNRADPPFDARVSQSKIQGYLDELNRQLGKGNPD